MVGKEGEGRQAREGDLGVKWVGEKSNEQCDCHVVRGCLGRVERGEGCLDRAERGEGCFDRAKRGGKNV